jgi:hypothetical protein
MTRSTDTRSKVRELADQISLNGGTPTPTLIRDMLGKGSPNTIVSELKAWQASKGTEKQTTPTPARLPLGATNQSHALVVLMDELRKSVAEVGALKTSLGQITKELSNVGKPSEGGAFGKEIKNIETRFEGVQRRMLIQVDEARGEAVKWKQRFLELREESGTWQTAMRQKLEKLAGDNAWLRGRLGEPPNYEAYSGPALAPRTEKATGRTDTYPGHPRAAFNDDES